MEEISDEGHLILHFFQKGMRDGKSDFFFPNASIIISMLLCSLLKNNPRERELTCFHTKDSCTTVQKNNLINTGFLGLESWSYLSGGK